MWMHFGLYLTTVKLAFNMAMLTRAAALRLSSALPEGPLEFDQEKSGVKYTLEDSHGTESDVTSASCSTEYVHEEGHIKNISESTEPVGEYSETVNDQAGGNFSVIGYSNFVTSLPTVGTMGINSVSPGMHPMYFQYGPSAAPQNIYPAANNHLSYPMYVFGNTDTMCAPVSPVSNQYYIENNNPSICSEVKNIPFQSPEIEQPLTYESKSVFPIPEEAGDPDTEDSIRAQRIGRQSTVQWLLQNYETAEGESLRRSTLYNHYIRHCREQKIESVNAASFGKLIRSVFLGLRTRRLGTRGNSKYHYYGIRIKPGSRLNYIPEEEFGTTDDFSPPHTHTQSNHSRLAPRTRVTPASPTSSPLSSQENCNFFTKLDRYVEYDEDNLKHYTSAPLRAPIHGEDFCSQIGDIPEFPDTYIPSDYTLPLNLSSSDVELFYRSYRDHCEKLREAAIYLDCRKMEEIWKDYWRIQDDVNAEKSRVKRLSKIKLYVLATCVPIQQLVRSMDYIFYQHLVEIIVPDVLQPMSRSLMQSIKIFSETIIWKLKSVLVTWPREWIHMKMSAMSAFSRTLQRYISLNHIAQSVSSALEDEFKVQQMVDDIQKVDFRDIRDQVTWLCPDDVKFLLPLEAALQTLPPSSLNECVTNLAGVVARVLKPYEGSQNFEHAARQFLLQWSYFSSMFMKELTIANAESFGSFHLVRLFSDEYVLYVVVHHVSHESGETPVSVMGGECYRTSTFLRDYIMDSEVLDGS